MVVVSVDLRECSDSPILLESRVWLTICHPSSWVSREIVHGTRMSRDFGSSYGGRTMQLNQWKSASEQLLKHWHRSGISQLPKCKSQSVETAESWLESNAASILNTNELLPVPKATSVDMVNSADMVKEPTRKEPGRTVEGKALPKSTIAEGKSIQANHLERSVVGNWASPFLEIHDRARAFDSLNSQVVACRKCEEIACRRHRTVFGVGSINARVVMFGEAPGADEDRIGEPFVGAAGQLLDKILVASGLKRAEIYIVNALKCRPPNNRTPTVVEIENCRPYFETQLETIRPEYVVCWGSVAVRAVLGSTESVGRLRGKFHAFRGAKVMVTYHPAYLLRTPDAKKLTWEDMKMLMNDMGIAIPGSTPLTAASGGLCDK